MAKKQVQEENLVPESLGEEEAVAVVDNVQTQDVERSVEVEQTQEVVKEQDVPHHLLGVEEEDRGIAEIKQILENPSLTMAEKVKLIATSEIPTTRFATVMVDYNNTVGVDAPRPDEEKGASLNYNLYTRLMRILKTEDYNEFKPMFDVVNFIFDLYKEDAFSMFKLSRFTSKWSWGEKQLRTFQAVTTTICELCDRSTRKEKLSTNMSFAQLFNRERTVLTDKMIENIRRYYEE